MNCRHGFHKGVSNASAGLQDYGMLTRMTHLVLQLRSSDSEYNSIVIWLAVHGVAYDTIHYFGQY